MLNCKKCGKVAVIGNKNKKGDLFCSNCAKGINDVSPKKKVNPLAFISYIVSFFSFFFFLFLKNVINEPVIFGGLLATGVFTQVTGFIFTRNSK